MARQAAARPDTSGIRASDRERDATAAMLWRACEAGRLDLAETRARVGAAYTAQTRGQLHVLTTDLPKPIPGSIEIVEEVWCTGKAPAAGTGSAVPRLRRTVAAALLAGLAVLAADTLVWQPAAGIIPLILVLLAVLAAACHSIRQPSANHPRRRS